MSRPRPRSVVLFVVFALALTSLLVHSPRRASARSSVTGQSVQRWSHSNGGHTVTVLSDGTLVTSGNGVPSQRIRPQDGEVLSTNFSVPDIRPAVWASEGSRPDYLIGGYQDRRAVTSDGAVAWEWIQLGCCNGSRLPPAIDHAKGLAYITQNHTLYAVELATGGLTGGFSIADFYGFASIPETGIVYVASIAGSVARVNVNSGTTEWKITVDNGKQLQPGAVAADGSLVVSSGGAHLIPGFEPGRLVRLMPDGTIAWNLHVNAVTPPVIGAGGLIYVGTQATPINENGAGAIEARDLQTGALIWSTAIEGLPNDLLVGDDGAVYAGAGSFSRGSVYALDQATGTIRQTITNVPGAWEIVLRGGLLFASGTAVTAIPVAAENYDASSPWPVRMHDNQRTGNRQAPHLTAPREPAPQPSPAACPSEIPGLVAHWSADGNAQDTAGNLSGINVGGVTFEAGKRGRAFKFNGGGNYVSIPQKVYGAQGGTLELWFNWDGTNPSQAQAITGSFGGGTHASPGLYVWGGGVFSFYGGAERYTNVLVTPGQWNHAAVTYDAAHNVKAYVNGVLVNEYPAGDPNPFFDELQIGKCTNCTFPGFNGLVDELRVYDRPLTAPEIQASFADVNSGGCPVQPTPTPTPAPTPPFEITIDPGGYAGDYFFYQGNTFQSLRGARTLTLMPGNYGVEIGGRGYVAAQFRFDVDATGLVNNVTNTVAARAEGSTLRFNNTQVKVNPQSYAGVYYLHGHPELANRGTKTFTVVPGVLSFVEPYGRGQGNEVGFNIGASGDLSGVTRPASAHAEGNTLVLHNTSVNFNAGAYAGRYYPGGYNEGRRGSRAVVMVPGTRPLLDFYGRSGQTTLNFQLAADGLVSAISNPVAAQSSGNTITFGNVVVECDPTTFAGAYRLYADPFAGKVRTVVVPGLPLPVAVSDTIGGSVFVTNDAVTPSFLDLVVAGQTHRFNFRPVSAPFPVQINPGSYAGEYTVLGTNQTRPLTLSLMPGLYHFDNGSGGRFTFEVNGVGHVVNIQTPAAAHASGDTLFLHNSELVIDPQSFTGKLWLLGQNPHQTKPGLQSFTVIPGMAYQVDLGGNDRIGFNVATKGDVTNINNPAAAHGVANRLVFNNAVINFEPQSYTGSYFPGSHLNLTPFRGAQSIVLVPNMRYYLSVGDLYSNFWFRLDAGGQVTGIENPAAAHASGSTLVLNNVGVVFDPQAYAGYYYPHTHSFQDFRGRRETIVLVPNLTYPVSIGDLHSHFRFSIDGAGQITNVDNPGVAFVRDNALTLRNACVRVNPGGYADNYEMILVGTGRGEKTFTLVPAIRYYFRDSANQARPFTLDAEGQPSPSSLAVSLGGQSYDFTLAALACDQTPPSTTASLSTPPNGAGWNNSNVTLSLAATDGAGGTGVREITYGATGAQTVPQTTANGASATLALTAEGETIVSFYATDNAGNREELKTFTVRIDKTAPAITASADSVGGTYAPGVWTNRDVTISFGCTDVSSGVADVTGPSTLASEGADQFASGTCTDAAGNQSSATFGDVDIDKTAPVVNASRAPAANAAGWNISDVTASYTAGDALSGLAEGSQAAGSFVFGGEGAGQSHTFTLTDRAGNHSSATIKGVNIDRRAPAVYCATADGAWHADNVQLACNSSDGLSTLADGADASFSLTTSVPMGAETANAQTGSRQVCDLAGNCSGAGPIAGNKVDRKAPEITLVSPAQGASYTLGQAVSAAYNCSDGGSGISYCAGTVASGSPLNTTSIGVQAFAVQATDAAGNTAGANAAYTVGYGVCPQFDQTKAHKGGSTIPVKLRLCDTNGNNLSSPGINVTALGTVRLSDYAPGEVEDSGNANPDDDFRFTGDTYHFNLKTTGLSTGTYVLVFRAGADPLMRSVQFQIR